MTKYRCLNNLFGYCKDSEHRAPSPENPTFVTAGGVHTLKDTTPTSCTLDPRNCGFFIFWDEACRDIQPIEE
ncbi:unnamed protein product [marine sediment metagenome]|uniref:Uncharacterized protein n=1 Tax=marine sediment metagenome TaxID=412755 RepID=X1P6M8_9ZZZZ